jgi:addiction module HigA family antidote
MPRPAVHPGEILAEELDAIGMTPTALATQLAVPPNRLTQIIRRQRGITGDTALRLAHWFGTSAEFWLTLQTQYDLHLAETRVGADIEKLPVRAHA